MLTSATSDILTTIDFGPTNITRLEGERNVFIPCPFTDGLYQIIWQINGNVYTKYDLPEWCTTYAFGLLIRDIDIRLNMTSFRCLYPGTTTKVSSLGVLTVRPRP